MSVAAHKPFFFRMPFLFLAFVVPWFISAPIQWGPVGTALGQGAQSLQERRDQLNQRFEGEYNLGVFTGMALIVDGGTLIVQKKRMKLDSIRSLHRRQRCHVKNKWIACGELARDELSLAIANQPVRCELRRRKLGGGLNAICLNSRGHNLSLIMVQRGWAVPVGPRARAFRPEFLDVRVHSTGMWGMEFVFPWDWQLGFRVIDPPSRGAGTCTIKGNVQRNGDRLYYRPYQAGYHRVQIDVEKHERWFCNEREAELAGWRKAPP